jgi:hypothetical protein
MEYIFRHLNRDEDDAINSLHQQAIKVFLKKRISV